jgi:hypothetical protein
MLKLATSSAIFLTLSFALIAEAANCPLVDISGTYMVQLITENPSQDCPSKGGGKVKIQPDGLIVTPYEPGLPGFRFGGGGRSGEFAGRVEPGTETMQWVGTSRHDYFAVEYTGTLRKGQLSGQFSAQGSSVSGQFSAQGGKLVKCKGKVIGFKTGK